MKRLTREYATFLYRVNNIPFESEDEGIYRITDRAHKLVGESVRHLPGWMEKDQYGDFSFAPIEICENDVIDDEGENGFRLFGIGFTSESKMDPDMVRKLRDFCAECFSKANDGAKIEFSHVAFHRVFQITEEEKVITL